MTTSKVPNPSQHIVSFPAGAEGAGGKKSRLEEPSAVILAGDILRWVIPKVGKFPKNVRYGLGARLESAHFDVLEELIRAQYARGGDRGRALELANTRLQIARHLARMARELNLLSEESAVYIARLQVDLGTQVGAWRKASAATANSSASCAIQPT
jgi:hypothetical protein